MAITAVSTGAPDETVSVATADANMKHIRASSSSPPPPPPRPSYFVERIPVLRAQAFLVVVATLYCVSSLCCYVFQVQIRLSDFPFKKYEPSHLARYEDHNKNCPPDAEVAFEMTNNTHSIGDALDLLDNNLKWANVTRRREATCSSWMELNLLVVVPGLGDAERLPITKKSLEAIRDSLQNTNEQHRHGFGCLIYVYKDGDFLKQVQRELGPICEIVYSEGLWTNHMQKVPPLTNSSHGGPYTHAAILMDDVDVSEVDMADFLYLMEWSKFGVATPAIYDKPYPLMSQRSQCLWHRTDFVDILFTVFKREEWMCWQNNLNAELNSIGWGMDATLRSVCQTTLGVIDVYEAYHRILTRSYGSGGHWLMLDWIASKTGVLHNDTFGYFQCATVTRPNAFDECVLYSDGTIPSNPTTVDWEC